MSLVGWPTRNLGDLSLANKDPSAYLLKELAVELKTNQDTNLIQAIEKPAEFIKGRKKKILELFYKGVSEDGKTKEGLGPIAIYFHQMLEKYNNLGLPSGMAADLALKAAERMYNDEVGVLEIEAPGGYTRAFGIAQVGHNALLDVSALSGEEIGAQAIMAYKQRKRANRAKKSGTV